jgi:hypothetical protein
MTSAAPSPSGHQNRGREHHPSNRGGCAELALLAVPPRPRTPSRTRTQQTPDAGRVTKAED